MTLCLLLKAETANAIAKDARQQSHLKDLRYRERSVDVLRM